MTPTATQFWPEAFVGPVGLLWAFFLLVAMVCIPRAQAAAEPTQPRIRSNQPELIQFYYDYQDKAQWHCHKAEAYRVHRLLWQAEREYLLALRFPMTDSFKSLVYNNLGSLSDMMKRPSRAQAYYRKALQMNPIQLVTYRNWLRSLQTMMSDTDIETALQDWHEEDRDNIIPRYTLSLLYEEQQRLPEAIQVLEELQSDIPYSPIADVVKLRQTALQQSLNALAKPPRVHIE
jgi:tetratricopeptide (TPR) repeat protein